MPNARFRQPPHFVAGVPKPRIQFAIFTARQIGCKPAELQRDDDLEGVPEPVRVGEGPPKRRGVEPSPARRHEERVLRAAHELRPAVAEIAGQPV